MKELNNLKLENQNIIDNLTRDSFEDRAFGCILGAFAADACGSYLEFEREVASEAVMDACMQMPGGGPFRLAKGQITDDSELAMCLMWALVQSGKSEGGDAVFSNF